ncbi:MAG TPA: hypothetical protein IAA78_05920 [Candidatus Avamphibacillus intestinigallinarum]|nr:hypothetical protein [Candidatus Avamphibacillus intestinigallinarum]
MELYTELLFSNWTYIAIAFTVFACIGLILGRYNQKEIIGTTIKIAVFSYIIVTIVAGIFMYDDVFYKRDMIADMDDIHEEEGKDQFIYLKYYTDEEKDESTVKIYAGNYTDEPYEGDITVITKEKGDKSDRKVYEDVSLKPNEKKEIDSYKDTFNEGKYYYYFEK